jgi:hypothetical protein
VNRQSILRRHLASAVLIGAVLPATLTGCSLFRGTPAQQTVPAAPATATVAGTATAVKTSPVAPTSSAPTTAPIVPAVSGYSFAPAPASVQRQFQTVAGQFRGVFSGLTARSVTKGSQSLGTVVLLGLHPELVGNKQVEQRLGPGMVKGMSGQGAKVTTKTVGGQDVAVATTKTTNIVAWYRTGTVVLVLADGEDPAASLAFAQAYIAAK